MSGISFLIDTNADQLCVRYRGVALNFAYPLITFWMASRKSFSVAIFRRDLIANMPASVQTLRISAPANHDLCQKSKIFPYWLTSHKAKAILTQSGLRYNKIKSRKYLCCSDTISREGRNGYRGQRSSAWHESWRCEYDPATIIRGFEHGQNNLHKVSENAQAQSISKQPISACQGEKADRKSWYTFC